VRLRDPEIKPSDEDRLFKKMNNRGSRAIALRDQGERAVDASLTLGRFREDQ
jgi:hypothetical protein